jgi:hypothetical protein
MRECRRCHKRRPIKLFPMNRKWRRRICRKCDDVDRKRRRDEKIRTGPRRCLTCFKCGTKFTRAALAQPARSPRSYCHAPCYPTPPRKGGDALSPFKRLFAACAGNQHGGRGSARGKPADIDAAFLRALWLAQAGRCPITGWELLLPVSLRAGAWPEGHSPRKASIDRIDQRLGYVRGNVRLVALIANYARHSWTDETVEQFARAVLSRTRGTEDPGTQRLDATALDRELAAGDLSR